MNAEANSLKGLCYSLAATVMFAGTLVAAKYSLKGFNPYTFSAVLAASAGIWAFFLALLTGNCRSLAIRRPKTRWKMLLLGLMTGAAMIMAWTGMKMLDPSFAAFLMKFQPVFAIFMGAVFLHEKLLFSELVAFIVMIAGVCLSLVGRWQIVGTGTVFVVLSCVLGSLQLLIGKLEAQTVPAIALVFYRVAIAAVIVTAWGLLQAGLDFNVAASYWFSTVLAAFCGPCVGVFLMFQSYHYWHLSRSSMVHTALPLFVLPMAFLFLRQIPAPRELIGGAVILLGASWLARIQLARAKAA